MSLAGNGGGVGLAASGAPLQAVPIRVDPAPVPPPSHPPHPPLLHAAPDGEEAVTSMSPTTVSVVESGGTADWERPETHTPPTEVLARPPLDPVAPVETPRVLASVRPEAEPAPESGRVTPVGGDAGNGDRDRDRDAAPSSGTGDNVHLTSLITAEIERNTK